MDAAGNVYVTGFFDSTNILFGSMALTQSPSTRDIFVAKYDDSGNVLWAKSAGGTSVDSGIGVALDPVDSVYVTGSFTSTNVLFESVTLTNANQGYYDFYVAKLVNLPQLTIIPSGTNVILSWPTNAAGFILQSTANLVSPVVWVTNSPPPIVVNGQTTVTNPASETQKFYRLIQ
jgi:hypothetical protein